MIGKLIFIMICSVYLTSCTPLYIPNETCTPRFITNKDLHGLNHAIVGESKFYRCRNYVINHYIDEACKLDANFINMLDIEVIYSYYFRLYSGLAVGQTIYDHNCKAVYYKIDPMCKRSQAILTFLERKTIEYELEKELQWSDFVIDTDGFTTKPYEICTKIVLKNLKINSITGVASKFELQVLVYTDISIVNPSYLNDEILGHLNNLLILASIYAKRAEYEINYVKNVRGTGERLYQNIDIRLSEYNENLQDLIQRYLRETDYGNNADAVKEWDNKIEVGLKQYYDL